MTQNRKLTISIGNSRKDTFWKRQELTFSDLCNRLEVLTRSTETLAEYMRMSKPQQDDLKDIGGFVGGALSGPQRKANAVISRDLVTLDLDSVPANATNDIIKTLDELGYSYCIYSTRKHAPNKPRLRIVLPSDRTMSIDEYGAVSRRIAERIGIAMADPTTFEVNRMFFWFSACADTEVVFKKVIDAPFFPVDDVLSTYANWRDMAEWPVVPGSEPNLARLAVKQGDPTAKEGIVGAFCRVYDVHRALDELLPGIYEQTDTDPNRYTYTGGSTAGGAVIYDDGKFLYSHHATDPCSGRLVNSFDLVRLHMFGDKDDNAQPDTPINKLPSYKAMLEYANGNDEVALKILQERHEKASQEFTPSDDDQNWMLRLKRNTKTGEVKNTIDNALLILEHDPRIRGRFGINEFSERREVRSALPWPYGDAGRLWDDSDDAALYWWMEREYGLTGRGNIDAAVSYCSQLWKFNPVREYLDSLKWDGKPRLDTLFIDYLGAEDTSYTRTVTRKIFCAAVARALQPGIKFDSMLVLCGTPGAGKSTLPRLMTEAIKGYPLFNDSITTFEGKEAEETLRGAWIVEVPEMNAFQRSEVAAIKQFLSKTSDTYRAAYARNSKDYPRRCVFFGTSNEYGILRDPTGNRRFWPVDIGTPPFAKDMNADLTTEEIGQIWAEARHYWQDEHEALYLTGEMADAAMAMQEAHMEEDPLQGQVEAFIARKIPANWREMTKEARRGYWLSDLRADDKNLVRRTRISAAEVMNEMPGLGALAHDKRTARQINNIFAALKYPRFGYVYDPGGGYGKQRGFIIP